MATANSRKLTMTTMPTRSSVHASDRRCTIHSSSQILQVRVFFSVALGQEAFDVLVLGPAKNFVRSFKNNCAVTKHEKACIGDAEEIIFRMEADFPAAVGGIFRS